MHRIDTATAQKDKFGQGKNGFTRGNPQTGTPATQLDYLYCDAIQEEIANAIESAGIKLDKSKHDQLATAIKEFVKKGSVKLNSSINSTSETEAATSKAVKEVCDLAAGAVKKSGDDISGQIRFSPSSEGIKFLYENGCELAQHPSSDSFIYAFYDAKLNTWTNKLRYANNGNTWRFENVDDVTVNNKSVLKAGDAVQLFGDLANINLNSLTGLNEGVYFQGRNVQATTENNYPLNEAGTLQVLKNGADGAGCCQIYTAYRNARQFIRNYRGGTKTFEPWVEQITTANVSDFLPVGIPMPWPTSTPPQGWFECNGAAFDKNKFPRLAAAYRNGRLPDLRGEFIRGLDNGRGVDAGRTILSHQDCEIQSHNHSTPIRMFAEQGTGNPWGSGGDKHEGDYIFNSHYTGGNETRPRNVAFMYIVKAE
jgi:phage-related tail fiber protein